MMKPTQLSNQPGHTVHGGSDRQSWSIQHNWLVSCARFRIERWPIRYERWRCRSATEDAPV